VISPKVKTAATLALVAGIMVLAYWSTFRWLANSWLSIDYYSHGFLIPVVSGVIAWTERRSFERRDPSIGGVLMLILGALLYAAHLLTGMSVLGAFSFLVMLAGLVIFFFGVGTARRLLFPLAFLVFMVPLPFMPYLAFQLQVVSLHLSSCLLQVIGLPISVSGQEIFLGDLTFTIGAPCSGINSLLALVTLSSFYAYVLVGPFYRRLCLVVLAVPLAIACNVARISSVIAIAYHANVETAMNWFHTLSSPLLFVLEVSVLILLAWIMKCRINPRFLGRQ
jgi:exosortase